LLFHHLDPLHIAPSGAYAIVGMGAFVAATTYGPLTAIIILFEMTNDYLIILPLMFSCVISTWLAKTLMRDSIYTMKLSRRGLRLRHGKEEQILESLQVKDVMRIDYDTINEKTHLQELINIMMAKRATHFPIVDNSKKLKGMLSIHDLKEVLQEERLSDILVAADIVNPQIDFITPDENLVEVMKRFGLHDIEQIPVVNNSRDLKLIGLLTKRDLLAAYNREILRVSDNYVKVVQEVEDSLRADYLELHRDYRLSSIHIPRAFVGKTLR